MERSELRFDKERALAIAGARFRRGEGGYTDPEAAYGPPLPTWNPQPKHQEVERQLRLGRRHNLLVGGSRSSKTTIFVKHILRRALIADSSRHVMFRYRANSARSSLRLDTLPKVIRMCYPRLRLHYHDQDGYATTPNGSEIWWGGLDEKDRVEKILGLEFCLHPDSKVLMADLTWQRARDVAKGDEIIAFPEELDGHLKLIRAKVEYNKQLQKRRYRVVTTRGETVVSEGHKFVTYREDYKDRSYRPLAWKPVEELQPGNKLRFGTAPWTTDRSFDGGWLSGILDGEGWVSQGGVAVSQNPGLVLNRIIHVMRERNVDFKIYGDPTGEGEKKECVMVAPKSIWESMRMLGMFRPVRLLPKADSIWEGRFGFKALNGEAAGTGGYPGTVQIKTEGRHVAEILSIEEIDVGEVRGIQTSSKTLIHDGFLGHNCTIFLNESSQIRYGTVLTTRTRLAQVCRTRDGKVLAQQELMDLNPVGKSHYSHREHIQHIDPETRRPLDPKFVDREMFHAFLQPQDNAPNLDRAYLDSLARAPARYRKRYYEGQYADDVEGALWTMEALDHARVSPTEIPATLDRVVVAVDPSGTDGDEDSRSDDVGVIVAGREGTGDRSIGWLLEDATCNEAPLAWGRRVVALYRKWHADRIVAEANYGGAMVAAVIDAAARSMEVVLPPVQLVNASRGKAVRAEPVSVLAGHLHNDEWEGCRVRHAGEFVELEEELLNFSTFGYLGARSPNRGDSYVWAMTDLMLGEQVPGLWGVRDLELVS